MFPRGPFRVHGGHSPPLSIPLSGFSSRNGAVYRAIRHGPGAATAAVAAANAVAGTRRPVLRNRAALAPLTAESTRGAVALSRLGAGPLAPVAWRTRALNTRSGGKAPAPSS